MIMNGLQDAGLSGSGQRYLGPPTRVNKGYRYLGPPIKINGLGGGYPTFQEWLHGGAELPDLTEPLPDVVVDPGTEGDSGTGSTRPRAKPPSVASWIMSFLQPAKRAAGTATGIAKQGNQMMMALVVAGGVGAAAYFLLGKKRRTA